MSAENQVTAIGLTRVFGRRYAIKDLSFAWASGAVTAVIGANGAGKSTVLGVVAGRMAPTQGRVQYGDPTCSSPPRKRIGYLSHSSFLYRALTCRENLQLVAELCGVTDASRVDDVLARVGLGNHRDRLVAELSRGMIQRLAIGRVLLPKPGILLMDEPTTGLDESGRQWLSETLQGLATSGCAVVVVSHQRAFLSGLASQVLALRRGRNVYAGDVDEAGGWRALFEEHLES